MLRRPPRSTQSRSSAASDVYKRQSWRPRVGGRDWRRSRDSNPGRSLTPLNRLAGGCLQPLGHFSAQGGRLGRRGHLVYRMRVASGTAARRPRRRLSLPRASHRHRGRTGEKRVDIAGLDPAVVSEVERETSELLSRLIQIDTSNPPGNETAVAEFMDGWFREAGLQGEIVGEPADRRSFVLRLEGQRPGPSLLLLAG